MIQTLVGNPLHEAWQSFTREGAGGWTTFFRTTWDEVYRAAEILGVTGEDLEGIKQVHQSMRERPYPSDLGDGSHIALHQLRHCAVGRYAWAIPDDQALDALVALSPIVEIGAGTGYWAALLASRGADVVAYDTALPGPENDWHRDETRLYYPVQPGGPEMAAKHPDRTLFICWPPFRPTDDLRMTVPEDPENWEYSSWEIAGKTVEQWKKPNFDPDFAYEALRVYEYAGGQRVAYIGEGAGGCTAGPSFYARLGAGCPHWGEDDPCTCEPAEWEELDCLDLPQWEGIHDRLSIYGRKQDAACPGG